MPPSCQVGRKHHDVIPTGPLVVSFGGRPFLFVRQSRLVTMMAVGDKQRPLGKDRLDLLQEPGIGDDPHVVLLPLVVQGGSLRLFRQDRLEKGSHPLFGIRVKSVHLADVGGGLLHQPKPIRLGFSKGVFMRQHLSLGKGAETAAADETYQLFTGPVSKAYRWRKT